MHLKKNYNDFKENWGTGMDDKEKIKEAIRLLEELSNYCDPAPEYSLKGHQAELKNYDDFYAYLSDMSDIISEAKIILDPEGFKWLKEFLEK